MRTIPVLPDIKLPEVRLGRFIIEAGQPVTMKQWFDFHINQHPDFGNKNGRSQGIRIVMACSAKKEIKLEEEDYKVVMKCLDYNIRPEIAMACDAYYTVVENAPT